MSEEKMDTLIEDVFLEAVYGAKSRLRNEEWLEKVQGKDAKWIFSADLLRNKLLETADIDKRH